jgi:hypothetical protein
MKKIFLVFAVAAIALALTVPASAALKLTTKGELNIDGYHVNQNLVTNAGTDFGDASNSFYNMKLLIQPTLHINDKVRIHSRITIMERNWTGGDVFTNNGLDYRGTNDFWVEQVYVSFPLFGGTMSVGRMSGGSWAYTFQNTADNRDRIKYARKFGHVVIVGLIEKLAELDGGAVLLANPNANYDYSTSDINSYAIGAVIPFSKNIIYKPLFYFVDYQNVAPDTGWDLLMMNGLGLKFGGFFLDTEINFRWRERDNQFPPADGAKPKDWDEVQWSGWLEAGFKSGPVEVALGGWYLEGTDSASAWENNTFWGLGGEFQPTMLLFSEDMGVLWNSTGVWNNTGAGRSGYQAAYLRGAFKINDAMTLSGILAYVEGDEMVRGSKWDGVGTADDEIGTELNITFSWKFLPNLTYHITGAYLWTGDYYDDALSGPAASGVGAAAGQRDQANNVFGINHGITVQW